MIATCLAALSGQPPKPVGARLGRAGLTAKARAEPQWPMPWMRLAGVGTERAFSIRCFQVFAPAANSQCCFVLVRRSIIQRRMQPLTVVDGFDKGPDGAWPRHWDTIGG